MPPDILTHNVELTILIHKIIVSIVASAHELRVDQIKVFDYVETTLLNSGILSRLPFPFLHSMSRAYPLYMGGEPALCCAHVY